MDLSERRGTIERIRLAYGRARPTSNTRRQGLFSSISQLDRLRRCVAPDEVRYATRVRTLLVRHSFGPGAADLHCAAHSPPHPRGICAWPGAEHVGRMNEAKRRGFGLDYMKRVHPSVRQYVEAGASKDWRQGTGAQFAPGEMHSRPPLAARRRGNWEFRCGGSLGAGRSAVPDRAEPLTRGAPHQRRSAPTCSAVMPSISSTLRRLAAPATSRTSRRRTPSLRATNSSSASFAACSMGGAATRILRSMPCRPAISVRLARGWIYTPIRTLESLLKTG